MLLQQVSNSGALMLPLSLLLSWQSEEKAQLPCSVVHTSLEYWAGQGDS